MPQKLKFVRAPRPCDPADESFALQETDAAPGLRHRKRDLLGDSVDGRPSSPIPTRKLQQASKDQLLRRKQIAAPEDLRRNERSVEKAERVECLPYLEAEIGSTLLARGPETGPGRSISLSAILKTFGYTLGSDRVDAHGFTKTFLARGTAPTVPLAFWKATGLGCQNLAKPVPVVRF